MVQRVGSLKKDKPDLRDYIYKPKIIMDTLPELVDLRSQMSPIVDQGVLNSCTANAIVSGLREYLEIREGDSYVELSRLFLYWHERDLEGTVGQDVGAYLRDGMKVLQKIGVCPEVDFPYIESTYMNKPSAKAETDAEEYKITEYRRVTDLTMLKTCLAEGYPVVIGFETWSSFYYLTGAARTGYVPLPDKNLETYMGNHAILVVGYDNYRQVTICRNSYGENWGDKGYIYLPYDFWSNNLVTDMWTGSVSVILEAYINANGKNKYRIASIQQDSLEVKVDEIPVQNYFTETGVNDYIVYDENKFIIISFNKTYARIRTVSGGIKEQDKNVYYPVKGTNLNVNKFNARIINGDLYWEVCLYQNLSLTDRAVLSLLYYKNFDLIDHVDYSGQLQSIPHEKSEEEIDEIDAIVQKIRESPPEAIDLKELIGATNNKSYGEPCSCIVAVSPAHFDFNISDFSHEGLSAHLEVDYIQNYRESDYWNANVYDRKDTQLNIDILAVNFKTRSVLVKRDISNALMGTYVTSVAYQQALGSSLIGKTGYCTPIGVRIKQEKVFEITNSIKTICNYSEVFLSSSSLISLDNFWLEQVIDVDGTPLEGCFCIVHDVYNAIFKRSIMVDQEKESVINPEIVCNINDKYSIITTLKLSKQILVDNTNNNQYDLTQLLIPYSKCCFYNGVVIIEDVDKNNILIYCENILGVFLYNKDKLTLTFVKYEKIKNLQVTKIPINVAKTFTKAQ